MTWCTYYGSTRNMTPEQLKKHDVVITTYQTVAGEHAAMSSSKAGLDGPSQKRKKMDQGLFDVQWKASCRGRWFVWTAG